MSAHAIRMLFIAALLGLAGVSTATLKPAAQAPQQAPDLDALLPEEFGVWRRAAIAEAVLPAEIDLEPGEAVAYRAYTDDTGRVVTLVAAYGPPLGDSVRLHRPEACYVAQGFVIRARARRDVVVGDERIPVVTLDAQGPSRREAVTYWLRDGAAFTTKNSDGGWQRLLRGAAGADGALVRVSTIGGEAPQFALNGEFLAAFIGALSPEARTVLLGEAAP